MRVLKFGGTSVGTPAAAARAARIIAEELPEGGLVVVSALSGTTDLILKALGEAARGALAPALEARAALEARHWAAAGELGVADALAEAWPPQFQALNDLLQGVGLLREASARSRDAALAVGETLSAHLLAALLARAGLPAAFRDVRDVLRTDARHGRARPDLTALAQAARAWRADFAGGALGVTQGFLGAAAGGATTTLGRGGSDTSASLLGEALGAEEVQIWTDVDGVLSADPSLVPGARPIPAMSLREAAALSAYGAKVLHADALAPARRAGFRLVVANTHRPQGGRTVIQAQGPARRPGEITSVAYKEGVVCLRLAAAEDPERLFQAAARLQEAGATRYGLVATPDGGLLVAKAETPEAEAALEALAGDGLAGEGLRLERGWAVIALVGEGLGAAPGRALSLLEPLAAEPVAALLAGDTGVALACLVPDARLSQLIPLLHAHCIETITRSDA